MGKTRLALAVARQHLLDASPQHGVYFVPLASLSEPTQIVSAVADVLNFSLVADGQQGSHKQLFDYLSQKEMLIVLDNFEHLLAGTSLVSELLQTAPRVQIVATSRERLQLQEEQVYPIQGLSFPETVLSDSSLNVEALQGYTAVQLFIQTVLRIQPNFNPQPEELPTLIQICRLLNGMPLAVELAAGWADMLPIADILAEIQRSLDFLETEVRNVPERHRSMRAVFDASWQRLSVDEQAVFAQLTIFQGGFTREVGQAVTSASLRLLGRLVNKSLLYYDAHQKRYQIHELLRQYGAERLEGDGERATAVARQHGLYYLTLLHQHTHHLKSQRQQMALAEIEVELGNIRMAWHWAIEQKAFDYLSQAMDALRLFYEWKGLYQASGEAAAEVEMAIANLGTAVEQLLLVKTLTWQALVCRTKGENKQGQLLLERSNSLRNELAAQGHDTRREQIENLLLDGQWALDMDFKLAPKIYEQACNIAETLADEWYQAQSLRFWGMAEYTMGQYETAEKRLHKALTLARQTGDMRLQARILDEISQLAAQLAQFEKAEQYVRQSYAIYQSFADPLSLALGTGKLGIILIYAGKVGESVTLLQQSFTLFQDIGNESMLAQAYIRLGLAQTYGGKPTVARANMEQGLALYRQLSNVGMAGWALWGLGETLLAVADYEEAQQVFGESTLLIQQAGHLDKAIWSLGLMGLTASF
jgi:predicted ATPase